MKKLLLLTTVLTSIAISACPNLAGSYNCVDTDAEGNTDSYSMSISQQGNKFTITDVDGSYVVVADGTARNVDGAMMTSSCSGNQLLGSVNESFQDEEGNTVTMTAESVGGKSGGVMTMVTTGRSTLGSMTFDFTSTSVCTEK